MGEPHLLGGGLHIRYLRLKFPNLVLEVYNLFMSVLELRVFIIFIFLLAKVVILKIFPLLQTLVSLFKVILDSSGQFVLRVAVSAVLGPLALIKEGIMLLLLLPLDPHLLSHHQLCQMTVHTCPEQEYLGLPGYLAGSLHL